MTIDEAYSLLPERVQREMDAEALDRFVDLIAANSKHTNTEVFIALARLISYTCNSGSWEVPSGAGRDSRVQPLKNLGRWHRG
jgi:uncharacterized membrane protein